MKKTKIIIFSKQLDWSANENIRPACLPSAGAGDYDQWMSTVTGPVFIFFVGDRIQDGVVDNDNDYHDDKKKSSGWGTTSSGGSTSNVLLEVDVKVKLQFSNHNLSTIPTLLIAVAKERIHSTTTLVTTIINITTTLITAPPQVISNSECNGAYGGITNNMLCAADASGNGGSDACQVDVLDHNDVVGCREG